MQFSTATSPARDTVRFSDFAQRATFPGARATAEEGYEVLRAKGFLLPLLLVRRQGFGVLGQFLANFSVLTSCVELRRVLPLLSQTIDNWLDMQLIATHGNRPKHWTFQLIIAWSGVQIPLGPLLFQAMPESRRVTLRMLAHHHIHHCVHLGFSLREGHA